MLVPLAAALVAALAAQSIPVEDVAARMRSAQLHARAGQTAVAEDEYRALLRERPYDVDVRIALAGVILRRHAWREALTLLTEIEPAAGENADLFATLARAYRRSGDDRRALEYLRRAKTLSPRDTDIEHDYEDTAQAYGHSVSFQGFGQHVSPSTDTESGTLAAAFRVAAPLRIGVSYRVQHSPSVNDVIGGAGFDWRLNRATTLTTFAQAGPGNTSLPTSDVSTIVIHYTGPFEVGGDLRLRSYNDVGVIATSPTFAWDRSGRWRLDSRYTLSHLSFHGSGKTSNDSSVLLRGTWRRWWRFNVNVAYAYGIESFEDLTIERLSALGSSTVAAGVRIRTPRLAQVFATWEHQWRSDSTKMDRVTLAISRSFP